MTKPLTVSPEFDAVIRRMLSTPPEPRVSAEPKQAIKKRKRGKAPAAKRSAAKVK